MKHAITMPKSFCIINNEINKSSCMILQFTVEKLAAILSIENSENSITYEGKTMTWLRVIIQWPILHSKGSCEIRVLFVSIQKIYVGK